MEEIVASVKQVSDIDRRDRRRQPGAERGHRAGEHGRRRRWTRWCSRTPRWWRRPPPPPRSMKSSPRCSPARRSLQAARASMRWSAGCPRQVIHEPVEARKPAEARTRRGAARAPSEAAAIHAARPAPLRRRATATWKRAGKNSELPLPWHAEAPRRPFPAAIAVLCHQPTVHDVLATAPGGHHAVGGAPISSTIALSQDDFGRRAPADRRLRRHQAEHRRSATWSTTACCGGCARAACASFGEYLRAGAARATPASARPSSTR